MFETGAWTPADVAAVIANPFYAICLDADLCRRRGPLLLEEDDWVSRNAGLISQMGPSAWLGVLLRILQGTEGEPGAPKYPIEVWIQANPATAVHVHESFAAPHRPDRSEEEWLKENVHLLSVELGPTPYLKSLLAILRGATLLPSGTFFGFSAAGLP